MILPVILNDTYTCNDTNMILSMILISAFLIFRFHIDNQGDLVTKTSNLPENTFYEFKVKATETG